MQGVRSISLQEIFNRQGGENMTVIRQGYKDEPLLNIICGFPCKK